MSNTRTYGGYRTGGLWVAAGISFGAVVVGSALALFGMLEYDERCTQGLVTGPGELRNVRSQAFPPATICEFEHGDVTSVGGGTALGAFLWLSMLVLVVCLLLALIAEWFEPRLDNRLAVPRTRVEKVRRTGVTFFATGAVFLMFYALAGWKLLAGPSSACSTGADWGVNPPRTLKYRLPSTPGDLPVRQRSDAPVEPGLDGFPGNGVGRSGADGGGRIRARVAALADGSTGGSLNRPPTTQGCFAASFTEVGPTAWRWSTPATSWACRTGRTTGSYRP